MFQPARSLDLPSAARLVQSIGGAGFDAALQDFFHRQMGIEHLNCLSYSGRSGFDCFVNVARTKQDNVDGLTQAYLERYFRLDPHFEQVVSMDTARLGLLLRFDARRIPSAQYRSVFWQRTRFRDKLSLVFHHDALTFYCNFYRTDEAGAFSSDDVQKMQALVPLVEGLVRAHRHAIDNPQRALPDGPSSSARPALAQLSARERLIMDLVLAGLSNEAIALDQHLSLNTVKTYRRRLYAKLQVSTANELHARYGRSVAS